MALSDISRFVAAPKHNTRWIWIAIAIASGCLVAALPEPKGLSHLGQLIVAIFASIAILWASQALNNGIASVLMIALLIGVGVKPTLALSGFSAPACWVLLTVLFYGFAMKKTGLAERISCTILSLFPCTYEGILSALFVIGFTLALGIPSMTVRTAIMVPVSWALVQSLKLPARSRGSALIVLTTIEMAVLPGLAFLYGVADIEKIREHLGIERWQVFGGSWGSTLALAYSQTHPDRVTEIILRGIFLLRKQEIDWFYQRGASALYPDAWEPFLSHIPEAERRDLLSAYYRRLTSDDPAVRLAAARIWSGWEGATSKLLPDPDFASHYEEDAFALAFARIEVHYFFNKGFLETDDQLLRSASRIRQIPGAIVQGRYDVVCPMESAWALHRAWPEADLIITPDSGHSAFDPPNSRALVAATDRLAFS